MVPDATEVADPPTSDAPWSDADTAEVPGPSNSGAPWSDADDQQRARVLAQIYAAHAALKELDAKKKKSATQSSTEPVPGQKDSSVKKPMTLNQQLDALMLTASKIEKAIPEATSGGDWNKSTDAGTSGDA